MSIIFAASVQAQQQDTLAYYSGHTIANKDYHSGRLTPVMGVHNIQILRANRHHPDKAAGFGWTYNHQPMIAYWKGTYFVEYLSDPVNEHQAPGHTLLATSDDGYNWAKPQLLFPAYDIPDGTKKNGAVAHNLKSVMHQRQGFFVSSNDRLLAVAYHGLVIAEGDDPNDGHGIGRVVREIKPDGSFGPIYFIHYNKGWVPENTSYPYYTSSDDKGFVKACNEMLNTPLIVQQWVEESDPGDPLIPLNDPFKAMSYYHLPDGRVVGFWKHALTSISEDDGKTWNYHPVRAPGFINANGKIWGQRTGNGKYVTVYNPSEEFRWPLALSVSDDGLEYTNLLLVNGQVPPRRYMGAYKSYGPQYVRGILPGNGDPPGDNFWVSYSMNKEDIWVGSIPVPITSVVKEQVDENFDNVSSIKDLQKWNIYSPQWAPVSIEKSSDGTKYLQLEDHDRYDFAKVQRLFPKSKKITIEFTVVPQQKDFGLMQIEPQNAKGSAPIRLVFDDDGVLKARVGPKNKDLLHYNAGKKYHFRIRLDANTRRYTVHVNGEKKVDRLFFFAVRDVNRIVFRTGGRRHKPTIDVQEKEGHDLPLAGETVPNASYLIKSLKTEK